MTVPTAVSGLFKPAENQTAYLKVGMLGFGGSGKTYTSALFAKGVYELLKAKGLKPKPVAFIDTETGSDWLVPFFKQWEVPLVVSKSRAFTDLVAGIKEAEENSSVLIIDSVSHFWTEVQESYKKAKGRTRLQFQDWGPIKSTWARFTDSYLNSRLHIIMCGRAGYEYDYFTDEAGEKQLEKTGTRMKAEGELGYEPSLLIEMAREPKVVDGEVKVSKGKKKLTGLLWDHVGYVLKDRSTKVEGCRFVNPTFADFAPVVEHINIGGQHIGVVTSSDSQALFAKDSDKNYFEKRKRVEILKEEIMATLLIAYPGRSAEEVKAKTVILKETFGTGSWVALDEWNPDALKEGLAKIEARLNPAKAVNNGVKNKEASNV